MYRKYHMIIIMIMSLLCFFLTGCDDQPVNPDDPISKETTANGGISPVANYEIKDIAYLQDFASFAEGRAIFQTSEEHDNYYMLEYNLNNNIDNVPNCLDAYKDYLNQNGFTQVSNTSDNLSFINFYDSANISTKLYTPDNIPYVMMIANTMEMKAAVGGTKIGFTKSQICAVPQIVMGDLNIRYSTFERSPSNQIKPNGIANDLDLDFDNIVIDPNDLVDPVPPGNNSYCTKCHNQKQITCPYCMGAGGRKQLRHITNYTGVYVPDEEYWETCDYCNGAKIINCPICNR